MATVPAVLNIPPPPVYDEFLKSDGKLTQPWQDWFSLLQETVNQLVDGSSSVFSFEQIEAAPVFKLKISSGFSDAVVRSVDLTLT